MNFVYGGIVINMTFSLKKKINILVVLALVFGLGVPSSTSAQAAGYSVAFTIATAEVGDSLTVNWQAPTSRQSNSWVGIYKDGDTDTQFLTYKYLPQTGSSGQLTFTIRTAGTYEARIFSDGGYARAGVSADIEITIPNDGGGNGGGNGSFQVSSSKSTYDKNESININWQAPTSRQSNSWVGIYKDGATDTQFLTYKYLPQTGSSGQLTFTIRTAGTYEARIFSDGGYNRVDVSANFSVSSGGDTTPPSPDDNEVGYNLNVNRASVPVGGQVTVSWQAPNSANRTNDWIGLYRSSNLTNIFYQDYRYTNGTANGSTIFTLNTAGTYEFRYLKNNGYTDVATSRTVTVSNVGGGGNLQCALSNTQLQNITNYPERQGPVIAFGDSLTAGVGALPSQDYVTQLSNKSGVSIINAGVSGNTTRDALARLNRDVLSKDPSVVLVWLGGNDILQRYYEDVFNGAENPDLLETLRLILLRITGKLPAPQGITEAETFENLTQVVTRIQNDGAVVIMIGFSGGVFDDQLESRYQAVANETNSIYVPNAMSGVIGRPSRMGDLVHPNGVGYGIIADKVLPYLACVVPD
jgi:acyl-CoA thioesterase-1